MSVLSFSICLKPLTKFGNLNENGINGKLLNLLRGYLSNRRQHVPLNGTESEWGLIGSGVRQGSIRGSLAFLLYINDSEDCFKSHINIFFC